MPLPSPLLAIGRAWAGYGCKGSCRRFIDSYPDNGQKYLDRGFGSVRFILDISKVHKLREKIPGVGFYPFPL